MALNRIFYSEPPQNTPTETANGQTIGHPGDLVKEKKSASGGVGPSAHLYKAPIPGEDQNELGDASRAIYQDGRIMGGNAEVHPSLPGDSFDSSPDWVIKTSTEAHEEQTGMHEEQTEMLGKGGMVLRSGACIQMVQNDVEAEGTKEEVKQDHNGRREIPISKFSEVDLNEILGEHGSKRASIEFALYPVSAGDIPAFPWKTWRTEPAQKDNYIGWLEKNIPLPDHLMYFDVSSKGNFLTTHRASARITMTGTLDVAVRDRGRKDQTAIDMRVGIETKKHVKPSHEFQAVAELLSASAVSSYRVAILLTNLRDHWQLFWLEKGRVVDCLFNRPAEGAFLLRTLASDDDSAAPVSGSEDTINAPYKARCTFAGLS